MPAGFEVVEYADSSLANDIYTMTIDPKGRIEMLELIRDISNVKGIHVILSSHLLPDVEWVCQEATVIHKGRIVASGRRVRDLSLEELEHEWQLVKLEPAVDG